MQVRKTLAGIVLAGALALALNGCGGNPTNTGNSPGDQTIIGNPVSVAESVASYYGGLATVIDVDGKKVLAYHSYGAGGINMPKAYAKAVALIQSEISDRDTEPIELTGKFKGELFKITKINANGYQIDLDAELTK